MTDPLAYEKARFSRIASEHMLRSPIAADPDGSSIGTLNEKILHAVLKDYMTEQSARQEVRLDDRIITARYPIKDDKIIKRDADRYIADILTDDNEIIEIQTGSFYPLAKKIDFYLRMTDCRVTVVHPIAACKWLRYLDGQSGEISARRRSPKKATVRDIAGELYWLSPYLAEPRFSLQLELLEVEEIRVTGVKKYRGRHRSERYDCIPLSLLDEVVLACPEDYATHFLPDEMALPSPFNAKSFSKACGIRGKAVYGILGILCDLGYLRQLSPEECSARAKHWTRTNPTKQ